MSKEAMKLALEDYLSREMPAGTVIGNPKWWAGKIANVLAKQEQGEPVAWMLEGWGPDCGPYFEIYRDDEMGWRNKKEWTPLYTTPQQRTWERPWVSLTDEDRMELYKLFVDSDEWTYEKAIEAKLKEKNT